MSTHICRGKNQPHRTPTRFTPPDFSARAERREVKRFIRTKKTTKSNKRGFA